jgi:hypothetical protein
MRGVEVDHNLYQPNEAKSMTMRPISAAASLNEPLPEGIRATTAAAMAPAVHAMDADLAGRVDALESACASLQTENRELREQVAKLREAVEYLRHVLGGG